MACSVKDRSKKKNIEKWCKRSKTPGKKARCKAFLRRRWKVSKGCA
jgi:hypothetical protein